MGIDRTTDTDSVLDQWRLAPFHLGSFIGPYTGASFPVFFPLLQSVFGVDRAALSTIVPAYLATFGLCQFFSGTISDLTSRRSTILAGFGGFGFAALVCALAPNLPVFLLGCVLLGIANAFTTPILLATLGDTLPTQRLPRTVTIFSAANQAGHLLGPLVAGLLVAWSWRLFFVSATFLSWVVGLWLLVWFARFGHAVPHRPRYASMRAALRDLVQALDRATARVVALAFLANAAIMGTAYLLGQALRDLWQLDYALIGLIVALYGVGAILFAPVTGMLLERLGTQRSAAIGLTSVATTIVLMAAAPNPPSFALAYLALGLAAMLTWTAFSILAVEAAPSHRGTTSAYFLGARFMIQGLAPALYTPVYGTLGPRAMFALSSVLALAALLPLRFLRPSLAPPSATTAVHSDHSASCANRCNS
jgi:MFS family permease